MLHFQFNRVGFGRTRETNFHAKHPLAELKLKGAKVSVTIENNQTLAVVSFCRGGAAISNLIIFESAV